MPPDFTGILVRLQGDDKAPLQSEEAPDDDELSEPAPAEAPLEPEGFHLKIQLPGIEPEILSIDKDLTGAEPLIEATVKAGYWIHGPVFFAALSGAIDSPLANEYQGSQQPPRRLSQVQTVALMNFAQAAIRKQQKEIDAALEKVEQAAADYATARLKESQEQLLDTAGRYIDEIHTRARARAWLSTSELAGGAHTFEFVDNEGLDLVKSLFTIWTAYKDVRTKEATLARIMKESGPEMQRIAGRRWTYVRGKDKSTPSDDYASKDYGVQLMRLTNPKRPDLVAEATKQFPEPKQVTAARTTVFEAAGVLASTLADEATSHPLLYRIWSPALAEELWNRFNRPDIKKASMDVFSPVFHFREAVSSSLRSSWSAATSLLEKISRQRSHVWQFPLLISAAVEQMQLADDAFERVAAEHRVAQLLEEEERLGRFFVHASSVLTAAGLLVRMIPAPAATLPASIAIAAIDAAIGGLGLLVQYFKETNTREGFRAFLSPGDSFAASDGSYLGTIVGAAFLRFGVGGMRRSTFLEPPKKAELVIGSGLVTYQEFQVLNSQESRP